MKPLYSYLVLFSLSLIFSFQLSAQAPTLGTAANFVFFSTVGAISNTGISQVTGDVGTNAGAVTNFGNVNGVMQTPPNGATLQAVSDINNTLAQINSASPVNTIAPALGGGQILFAGVYHVAGVATLNGELILDGQNNANAVFIFQLDMAFYSGFAAKVRLINNAQACNVFWRANGEISFANETLMKGNLIANNDAFHLGVNDTLQGRAFAINGAITLDNTMAFIPTGCGVPLPTGPAAPAIGSALGCYGIFTKTGDITDSGANTYVTGDIGSNGGTTGGYDPLKVKGNNHPSSDGSTGAAAGDLTTLYNTLDLMNSDITLLYPAQFGNGLVLTPHVYTMGGAASLTGDVYLNAQGLPDAVFVIEINGALTAASLSRVILVNGTQAKNVFWLIKGAATRGTDAIFHGTVVAGGAISTATGDSITGRIFTTVGAITTQASVITGDISGCGVLPLSWIYFNGTPAKNAVELRWGTSNEINNDFFTLEKSKDGVNFNILTTVDAAGGTGSTDKHYSFTDPMPFTNGYYRIAQTDLSGRKNYYRTIQVKTALSNHTKVNSYVQGNIIYTHTTGISSGTGSLIMYNMEGRKVSSQNIVINKEGNIYKTVKPLQKGVYLIRIIAGGEIFETGKVLAY
ncbi:MAG: ice-binding family protein [Ferruginibacter sp.]